MEWLVNFLFPFLLIFLNWKKKKFTLLLKHNAMWYCNYQVSFSTRQKKIREVTGVTGPHLLSPQGARAGGLDPQPQGRCSRCGSRLENLLIGQSSLRQALLPFSSSQTTSEHLSLCSLRAANLGKPPIASSCPGNSQQPQPRPPQLPQVFPECCAPALFRFWFAGRTPSGSRFRSVAGGRGRCRVFPQRAVGTVLFLSQIQKWLESWGKARNLPNFCWPSNKRLNVIKKLKDGKHFKMIATSWIAMIYFKNFQ